jgi:hypothetical protein
MSPSSLLVIADDRLYFTECSVWGNGDVASCPTSGCPPNPTQTMTTGGCATAIALAGPELFAAGLVPATGPGGGIFACTPDTSGACSRRTLTTTPGDALVTLDGNVYFINQATKQLLRCPTSGCSGSPTALAAARGGRLVAYAGRLYWIDPGTYANGYRDGAVYTCPAPECAGGPKIVAGGLTALNGIAVSSAGVFWAAGGSEADGGAKGSIGMAPLDGSFSRAVATDLGEPAGIAADDAYLFWTDRRQGTVMEAAIDGRSAEPLAVGQASPATIAIDATHVYWVAAALLRVPR